MRKSGFTEEQIIGVVCEYEAAGKLNEPCRGHNSRRRSFASGAPSTAGWGVSDAKQLKALEEAHEEILA